jgi:hypothetical protein
MSTSEDPVATLEAAHRELEALEANPPVDADHLEAVADAYEAVAGVLDGWEERATDWDDFQGYVEFRDDLSETMSAIPEDLPESEALVEADRHVKTASPTESLRTADFEAAREALAPARAYADYREDLADARRRYRETYRAVERRRREFAERIEDLERLQRLGDADLDAPIEDLRGPVSEYNDAVTDAVATFRSEASAREVLGVLETAAADYPLVDVAAPPDRLLAYVREAPAGELTVPALLEYADYSESKLAHYVDEPGLLKRRVATNRTYLDGLDAAPFRVEWPPPPAETLRFRTDELLSVVGRFAGERTTRALRSVRAAARRDDYRRLREAGVAASRLSGADRERLAAGTVADDLSAAREERERLAEALTRHPEP